jgi:hypothetical protein
MTDDEYYPLSTTPVTLSRSTSAGLPALVIGCALLISACVLMAFNILLFAHGPRGIPVTLGQFAAVLGVVSVAGLGLVAAVLGFRSWGAARDGEPRALGVAATAAGAGGFVAWMIAGINLLFIVFSWSG